MLGKTNFAVLLLSVLAASGCRTPERGTVSIPDFLAISGENREWWDIYSVEFQGERKIRTRIGYLYRKFGPEDKKGKYYVLDPGQKSVGFILPDDYEAYLIEDARPPLLERKYRKVSTGDLDGGIKKILQVSGTVERERPQAASAPAPKAPATARAPGAAR